MYAVMFYYEYCGSKKADFVGAGYAKNCIFDDYDKAMTAAEKKMKALVGNTARKNIKCHIMKLDATVRLPEPQPVQLIVEKAAPAATPVYPANQTTWAMAA